MRILKRLLVACCLLAVFCTLKAQTPAGKSWKIAVFAPVYLDSAFTNEEYKLGKSSLPRYLLPGLEFYNGVMLAVDSLNTEKAAVDVVFYDTKSTTVSLEQLVGMDEMKDVSLIIASFNTRMEIKPLADFALAKKIPLISATYPNDGDTRANTFFVLLNPTLMSHIEAIYQYAHKYYPADNIILFRRQGDVGDLVQSVFTEMNQKTPGIKLRYKTVELPDRFTPDEVLTHLDSNKQRNIVFCAAINEAFALNLSKTLSSNKNYHAVAIGMPTWDGLRDISKDLEVVYSTSYNPVRTDKSSFRVADKYRSKHAGRPSDMVFKGFESMYRFTKLLLKYGDSLVQHLSVKEYKLFNDFDIQPTRIGKTASQPDYLENKKFYFIRKKDGVVKSVN